MDNLTITETILISAFCIGAVFVIGYFGSRYIAKLENEMPDLNLTIVGEETDRGYTFHVMEFPGIISTGKNEYAAKQKVLESLERHLKDIDVEFELCDYDITFIKR